MFKCASPDRLWKLVVLTLLFSSLPTFILPGGNATHPISNQALLYRVHQANRQSPARQVTLLESYGRLPLSFEANLGQTDSSVKFLSRGSGYTLFLRGDEAVLALQNAKESGVRRKSKNRRSSADVLPRSAALGVFELQAAELNNNSAPHERRLQTRIPQSQAPEVLRMRLVGANRAAEVKGLDELPGKSNYFIGADPKKWRTNVPTYARVKYEGVYPGVDLVYYGNHKRLEYDFVVAPGADFTAINLALEGVRKMRVDAHGDLVLRTLGGELCWQKPIIYQEIDGLRREV